MAAFLKKQFGVWRNVRPEVFLCSHLKREGSAEPLFLSGINGTRFFAWVGIPEGASPEKRVPAMVLIHGGLGTAYARWVNFWVKQGYAAIAMDNCGGMPMPDGGHPDVSGHWPRHARSGAPGWGATGDQLHWKKEDQWFTHAVSSVIFSHNYLRSLPTVDPDRIGITGVSWGGVLALIAAGIDHRFRALCPVYSCGWLYEQGNLRKNLEAASEEERNWWKNEWDPAAFLPEIQCPTLWFASTNDGTIFYPPQWQRSTEAVENLSERCLVLRLNHSHGPCSEEQPEIVNFFHRHLMGEKPLLRLSPIVAEGNQAVLHCSGGLPKSAVLLFTRDTDHWFERQWMEISAGILPDGTVRAELPEHWTGAVLALMTGDYLRVTSGYLFPHRL